MHACRCKFNVAQWQARMGSPLNSGMLHFVAILICIITTTTTVTATTITLETSGTDITPDDCFDLTAVH